MTEDQKARAEKMKSAINDLNSLCHLAKRRYTAEMEPGGNLDNAGYWNETLKLGLRAMVQTYEFCSTCVGENPHMLLDIAKHAKQFNQRESKAATRQ
jgi:hypothetical protein